MTAIVAPSQSDRSVSGIPGAVHIAVPGGLHLVEPGRVDSGRHGSIRKLRESPYTLLGPFNDDAQRSTAAKTRRVRLRQSNFGEFRVPGLRNVALTASYMHAGSLETLDGVASHYSTIDEERLYAGGERILRRLDLTARERADLVAFLETLTEKEPLHEFVDKIGDGRAPIATRSSTESRLFFQISQLL